MVASILTGNFVPTTGRKMQEVEQPKVRARALCCSHVQLPCLSIPLTVMPSKPRGMTG